MTLRGEGIAEEFHKIVEDYIERRFGTADAAALTLREPARPASWSAARY